MHFTSHILRIECAVLEAGMTFMTAEAFIMPFAAHCLNVLSDDWLFALLAFGSSPLCAFGLTVQAPSIAILLNVSLALLKGITTLSTEEMAIVPVLAQCNSTLSNDRSLAVLASGSKIFMPVKMTVEAQSLISILGQSLTFDLWKTFTLSSALDSVNAFSTLGVGLASNL
jgi:hypothetical protein